MSDAKIKTLWLRPGSGTYYYRRSVPERLKEAVGKGIVQISLGTRNRRDAIRAHATIAAEVAAQWRALEKDRAQFQSTSHAVRVPISRKDSPALAGELYRKLLAQHDDEPGHPDHWQAMLALIQPALPVRHRTAGAPKATIGGNWATGQRALIAMGSEVDALLLGKEVTVSAPDRRRICADAAVATALAYEALTKRALGDYSPDPVAARFPPAVEFGGWQKWYELYCKQRLPQSSSRKRQAGVLSAFFEFLGHELPGRVTEQDAIRWMEKRLLEATHSTVRKADLAHHAVSSGGQRSGIAFQRTRS